MKLPVLPLHVKPRLRVKRNTAYYDCTDVIPFELGERVQDRDGYTYEYVAVGRRPGAVTGGVYHTFECERAPYIIWSGVYLESILEKFPSPYPPSHHLSHTERSNRKMKALTLKPGDCVETKNLSGRSYLNIADKLIEAGAGIGEGTYTDSFGVFNYFGWKEGEGLFHDEEPLFFKRVLPASDILSSAQTPSNEKGTTTMTQHSLTPKKPGDYRETKDMTEAEYHALAQEFLKAGAESGEYPNIGFSQVLDYFGWEPSVGLYHTDIPKHFSRLLTGSSPSPAQESTLPQRLVAAASALSSAQEHHDNLLEELRASLPGYSVRPSAESSPGSGEEEEESYIKVATGKAALARIRAYLAAKQGDRPSPLPSKSEGLPEHWKPGALVRAKVDTVFITKGKLYLLEIDPDDCHLSFRDNDGDFMRAYHLLA